jgi:LacI family transcriptional regulator
MAEATEHLIRNGHSRIVLLCRKIRRLPKPGVTEAVFLETLAQHECPVSNYNLPDWEETDSGFQKCLQALFHITPPTALIVDEATYFVATMQFLLSRGLRVPEDVSILCTDDDPAFTHCHPAISRIVWDSGPIVRRIVNWTANVSRGKTDLRQSLTPAKFVVGGTIGPCRAGQTPYKQASAHSS